MLSHLGYILIPVLAVADLFIMHSLPGMILLYLVMSLCYTKGVFASTYMANLIRLQYVCITEINYLSLRTLTI